MRWPWTTPPPAKPLGFPSPRPAVPRPGAPTELEGTLEGIIFHNAATGYTVAALQTDTYQTATIVGTLVGVQPGERLRVTGQWATHPQYGAQFQIATYQAVRPVTAQGIETYLGSGLIKGIGPGTAHDIVQRFGERTLTILDESPDLLLTVPGVGPQRLAQIKAAWAAQRHIQEIMLFLQSHGVSPVLAAKIYRRYGDDAMRLVRADPYRLARDIRGVGFPTADDIAQQLGLARDDPRRLAAGLLHVLSQRTDSGHIYTPQPELLPAAAELLQADVRLVEPALADLAARGAVQLEDTAVYLRALYHGEVELAARLRGLLAAQPSRLAALADLDWDRAFRRHGRALSA
ncbi:MAG: ATP-dependent RecD-like DNA helicase, partial [Chloroflexi bacterium]|nr:ATP-dependent RecD-like DNA helicase [Chloroflexota bacterium]